MRCSFAPEVLPLEATPVDNLFILEYMPGADGTQLRVYLLGLMLCRYPGFDSNTLSDTLAISEAEILAAFTYWQKEGLVRIRNTDPLEVEYITPSERAGAPALLPGKYGQLIQAVQSLLAPRTMRPAELRRVYDWVEVYQLDESAVLELISHCLERKGRRVSISYIDTVARAWADAGVHTLADAHAQASSFQMLTGGAAKVLRRWNKSRTPTQDELALFEKWTRDWGFTEQAILAACPAVTKAERPSFAYLDGVLDRLRSNHICTEEQVAAHLDTEDESSLLAKEVFARMMAGRAARPVERAQLSAFLEAGLPKEILYFAAEQAQGKERPFGYLKKLLSSFAEQNVFTVEEARRHMEARQGLYTSPKGKAGAMDYPQKRYSTEELQHIFINLDEEM